MWEDDYYKVVDELKEDEEYCVFEDEDDEKTLCDYFNWMEGQ